MHTGADAEIMYMRTLRRWLAATLNKHHVHNTGIRGSNVQSDARCGRINTKETQTNFLLVGPLMVPLSELVEAWSYFRSLRSHMTPTVVPLWSHFRFLTALTPTAAALLKSASPEA